MLNFALVKAGKSRSEVPTKEVMFVLLIIKEGGRNHRAKKESVKGINPNRMNGNRLPRGVLILSEIMPKIGSFNAFHTAYIVIMIGINIMFNRTSSV
jgi:hypothetical protein